MTQNARRAKGSRKKGEAYLHLKVNPEARRLFRHYAAMNDSTMTEIVHRLICNAIGRDDLPAPSECGSTSN
jgi:hypothetical protein